MASNPVSKLYTCRYWALGPACPNIDAFGTNICPFAHWDTGRLASHFQQRGTCVSWKHLGYCGRGSGCWYEHRLTGVTGLFQGTIELTGFELQVADAASNSGFNTFSHEALFDLIWAVKRLALQVNPGAGQIKRVSLPPDPIYPDRYRPSGRWDNRNTRNKRKAMAKRQREIQSIQPKANSLPQHAKKWDAKRKMSENLIDFTSSENENTLDIGDGPANGAKRQRVSGGQNHRPTKLPTRPKGNARPSGAFPAVPDPKPAFKPSAPTQPSRMHAKVSRDPQPIRAPTSTRPSNAKNEIIKQMGFVKISFDDMRKKMNTCQETMRTLFDVHQDLFDDNNVMNALQKMSNSMNKVFDGAKEGAAEVDSVIAWLSGKSDNIL
ncbi:hypothetical protein ABEF95_009286 [Exophiala dermatitidis]